MVPFSGWIKYLLRWALLIILFLQCLKRSQAPAFWKQLSLACTWRTYESDTHFYFPPWTGNSWIRAMKILDFCDQLLDSEKKNQTAKPLWHTVDIQNFSLHCNVLLRSWFAGPGATRTTEPKPQPVSPTSRRIFVPLAGSSFSTHCFPPCPLWLRADVGEACFLCRLSSVHFKTVCLRWWLLFSLKEKKETVIWFNLNNCVIIFEIVSWPYCCKNVRYVFC